MLHVICTQLRPDHWSVRVGHSSRRNEEIVKNLFRSTEDQATYLSQEIEDAFQEQKLVLVSWIDLQKEFDKVWIEGLLVKLLRNGIASNIFSRIKSYLYNRRARVSVDRVHSKKILLRHGFPQGGVISPTLFLIFINDLVSELPKGVRTAALYADDMVVWCKEEYATTATYRMQLAADKLNSWTEKLYVAVNKDKSSTTLFTLFPLLVEPCRRRMKKQHTLALYHI